MTAPKKGFAERFAEAYAKALADDDAEHEEAEKEPPRFAPGEGLADVIDADDKHFPSFPPPPDAKHPTQRYDMEAIGRRVDWCADHPIDRDALTPDQRKLWDKLHMDDPPEANVTRAWMESQFRFACAFEGVPLADDSEEE